MNLLTWSKPPGQNLESDFAEALPANGSAKVMDGRLPRHAQYFRQRTHHALIRADLICSLLRKLPKALCALAPAI
jgi:hypothetical protein